ncbi:MAG: methyltransferase domain-containing protein [Planctomycetes bacterium]|nr:methyltransferase domain-containing protein [Planctomycetota bacterium]
MTSDWRPAPNIRRHPEVYERENEALARDGRLDVALREVADWRGRRLLDVGCGTGFWLPRYADASSVLGVEPDPDLLGAARARVAHLPHVSAELGSAEHLPCEDASFDVVHARFAYFFGAGAERGLHEVRRVLAPGGVFVAIDNAWTHGDFADLLRDAVGGNADLDPEATAAWWRAQGAERLDVDAGWQADSADELERILRIEFPAETVERFVARRRAASLSYAMALFVVRG